MDLHVVELLLIGQVLLLLLLHLILQRLLLLV